MAGAVFGGCPNTTYGESVGCVAITGNASVATILTAAIGAILIALGVAAFFAGLNGTMVLLIGGPIVLLMGIGLAVYYLSFGVYYDSDSFIYSSFGKKSVTYSFRDIRGQQLYLIQGGSTVVELHMADGRSVSIQSGMDGAFPFLDHAFAAWCRQTNRDPAACAFHDPASHQWFPSVEEI
jgi:hypothetical protein